MDKLKGILKSELDKYVAVGINGKSELTVNADENLYSIIVTGNTSDQRFTFTSLIVSVLDNIIIIEEDRNDKSLVDALMQAGIPREQIILAYLGEQVPTTI